MLVLKRKTGQAVVITVSMPNGKDIVIRVKMDRGSGSLAFAAPKGLVTVVREEISEHRVS